MQVPAQQRGLHVTLISVETSSDVSASNIFECVSNCWTLCDFRLLQVKGDPSTSFFCQIAVPWQLFGKPLKAMTSSSFYIKFQLWSKFLIYSISSVCVYMKLKKMERAGTSFTFPGGGRKSMRLYLSGGEGSSYQAVWNAAGRASPF